jgi:hypothetical protein
MQMNAAQRRQMADEGYIVVRGAVPPLMVEEARRAINHSIGNVGVGGDLDKQRATTYCQELTKAPVMTDVFNKTPLYSLCESAVGEGNLLPVSGAQIALRFPNATGERAEPKGHLDGRGTGTNGIPLGEFRRGFTILVVVLLSDLPEPYSGNFTVWPGTHHQFEQVFREKGPAALADSIDTMDTGVEPVQITGRAGDAVLCHHQLKHTACGNASPNIRYAVIFRACHKDVSTNGVESMMDIWREWPGLKEETAHYIR